MSRLFLGEKMDDIDNYSQLLEKLHDELKNKFISFIEKSGLVVEEKYKESIMFHEIQYILIFYTHYEELNTTRTVEVSTDHAFALKLFNIKKEVMNMHIKGIVITINQALDISDIRMVLTFGTENIFSKYLRLILDEKLKFDSITFLSIPKTKNLMSIDDEIFLIKCLYIIDDCIIDELFPELKVDGVYDFNSEEFKSKIEYLKLIEY